MTKTELKAALQSFDWFYDYSDDGNVWRAGKNRKEVLLAELASHGCRFEWWSIHHALFGQVIENCVQVGPDEYRGKAWAHDKHIASWRACNVITQDHANEILAWFDN